LITQSKIKQSPVGEFVVGQSKICGNEFSVYAINKQYIHEFSTILFTATDEEHANRVCAILNESLQHAIKG
jgi:hypothetical protein